MNGMRISSNNNNFNLQYSNNQRYNTFKNPNLMSYENSMNSINQSYNRENDIYNNTNNINEQEREKEKEQLPQEEDEQIIPERSLCDYINNDFLSDAVLKLNDIELYFHKIVLIACSDYLNNYFISIKDKDITPEEKPPEEKPENEENNEIKPKENKYQNKIVIDFPEIISSSFGGGNKKNCLEKILKYCYSNQNFKSIESDINQYNIFTTLELAHSLGIKSLKLNLEKKIIKNHLGKDNATKLAIESKIFDLKKLNKECINYIIQYFKDVKIFKNDIMDLDFETFKNIMNSDSINIETEKDISDFVLNYIKSRRDLPEEEKEEKPEIKEEQIKPNENENNEENKNIEENNQENKEEEKQDEEKKEEEKKEENDIKEVKEENNEKEKWKKYLYELKDSTKRKKLNNEQEKELIMCIRFSFLPHYELNKLINEPVMNDFKDILLQALSLKLNSYETQNIENNNNIFNSKPRLCFQTNENMNNNMNNNMEFESQNNYDMVNYNQSMPNLQAPSFYNRNKNSFNQNIPNNPMYKSMDRNNYNYNYMPNIKEEEEYKNDNINNYNEYDNENNNNFYNVNENQNEFDENNQNISEDESSINNNKINAEYFNINNPKEKEKINRYQKMFKSEKTDKTTTQNQNKEINESISSENENKSKNENQSNISRNYNPKFKYKSDFDHNGALYYIGTRGLTKNYENPHKLKLIKAFGSSLLSGNFSDFVGRKYTNLSTENEENSFFGVDLGPNRYLIPTSYSLRNRDSDTNVLLCWNFQGSNDKINFEILDKRIFSSETDEKLNDKTRKYRHLLKKPKTTSTWGVSKKIREKYPNGFRYFLLKQIGKNSSKNYNLAISGFEIYGEGIGSGWIFN